MSDKTRGEFEEVCDSLPVKITNNEKAVAQYIWTTQQKKIDELENKRSYLRAALSVIKVYTKKLKNNPEANLIYIIVVDALDKEIKG